MKMPVYCVRDNKAGFTSPFLDTNDNTAKRGFGYALNNNDHMSYSPADYALYRIGTFDTDTGIFEGQLPENICEGTSVIGEKK